MRADARPPADDQLARLVRAADPVREADVPDAGAPAARQLLATAKAAGRRSARRRTRRVLAGGCVLAVVTTAATYQVLIDRGGRAGESSAVVCVSSAKRDAQLPIVAGVDDPVRTCRERWPELFGAAAPSRLSACVDVSVQGSIHVYAGDPGVCAAHDATPYAGPSPDQLRLVDLRADLAQRVRAARCLSHTRLRQEIDAALARHRLGGWRVVDYENDDAPARHDGCASAYVDEPERRLMITAGLDRSTVE